MKKTLLLIFLTTSAFSLLGQQAGSNLSNAFVLNFPNEEYWPDKVHLIKATQVSAAIGAGVVSTTLPVGREVWSKLSQDHKTVAIQTKDPDLKGIIPIEDTDFLSLAIENQEKREKLRLAEQNKMIEEANRLKEQEEAKIAAEAAKKRDILVKSWSWSESSRSYFKAVGEIQNESDRELKSIQVEFITKDSGGNIINSGTALVHDRTLAPNESTTFDVLVQKRGGEESGSLAFRSFSMRGERYSYRIQGKD